MGDYERGYYQAMQELENKLRDRALSWLKASDEAKGADRPEMLVRVCVQMSTELQEIASGMLSDSRARFGDGFEDRPEGAQMAGAGIEPHDLVSAQFAAGVEAAAKLVEGHCCVSTCCDAQPGASTAEELAACVRKNARSGACEHEEEHWQHIEERGELSLRRHVTWCRQCGSLNDGTWRAPTGRRRAP
jgi:hypothetical protein